MKALVPALLLAGATIAGVLLGGLVTSSRHPANGASLPEKEAASNAAIAIGPPLTVVPPVSKVAPALRPLAWEELVPKDWDPLKKFRGMNFDALDDSDPRAIELLQRMRETWDNAPTNRELDGRPVRIAGYIVPLDDSKAGLLRFLLVPYYGACIHTPPPPSNQIIDVTPQSPAKFRLMAPVWVSGTLRAVHSDSVLGASGYQLSAESVEWYTPGLDHGLK